MHAGGALIAKHSAHLTINKPFYHYPCIIQHFGFALLFLDAGGLADLIDSALLIAHQFSATLELSRESPGSLVALFDPVV